MKVTLNASKQNVPLGALLTGEFVKPEVTLDVKWVDGNESSLVLSAKETVTGEISIIRLLARLAPQRLLYGSNPMEQTMADHWILQSEKTISLSQLETLLARSTFLLPAAHPSIADFAVLSYLKKRPTLSIEKNTKRWQQHMLSLEKVSSCITGVEKVVPIKALTPPPQGKEDGNTDRGKFVELPGAEMGKVVVRFPPEASGYLHVGHAKAALLNQHYQLAFNGKLILRFDDTNPDKEKEDFEKVILEDVSMLGIKPDIFTFTSDSFELIQQKCEQLIRQGDAYVDDTDGETMKKEREARQESKHRNNSVDKNLKMWEEMKKGTDNGLKCCVRAKIDMNSNNGCMRDPAIYRCKKAAHPRQGTKYNVYPTYDFACPIVDSCENVTHALRTTEYHDRDEQFYWVIDKLKMRKPLVYEYSRLNLMNTVLSKRKLTYFVDEGVVNGWDDPRMPTVRGVLRRGLTVEGLKDFILAQGSSKALVMMDWDKLWAFNKKLIEASSKRYYAVEGDGMVEVEVEGLAKSEIEVAWHPKDPSMGTKKLTIDKVLLVDRVDAEQMKAGDTVTFMSIGNVKIVQALNNGKIKAKADLDNKDFKKTLKVSWLTKNSATVPLAVCYMDNIISKPVLDKDDDFKKFIRKVSMVDVKMYGEENMRNIKKGDIVQIQRKGFFICDSVGDSKSLVNTSMNNVITLIYVPDGTKNLASLPQLARDLYEGKLENKKVSAPTAGSATPSAGGDAAAGLWQQVQNQGDTVRKLKSDKAAKDVVTAAVQTLLQLKTKYKEVTGSDWDPNKKPAASAPPSAAPAPAGGNDGDLWQQVQNQGDTVRKLKSDKAAKDVVTAAVQTLLQLKAKYKDVTGSDWDPNKKPAAAASAASTGGNDGDLWQQVQNQGDTVRKLKSDKAAKDVVTAAVQTLLQLKGKYKEVTGSDWDPNKKPTSSAAPSVAPAPAAGNDGDIWQQVQNQGDAVRKLKSDKAAKDVVTAAVQTLLQLKAKYKEVTGSDWDPNKKPAASAAPSASAPAPAGGNDGDLWQQVQNQGDAVRKLKSDKAAKDVVTAAVQTLLQLKAKYKEVTGSDWDPNKKSAASAPAPSAGNAADDLDKQIQAQGEKIRKLKSEKASKDVLTPEIATLLTLKGQFKEATGKDWQPGQAAPAAQPQKQKSPSPKQATPPAMSSAGDSINEDIKKQGEKIRNLKSAKASKDALQPEIDALLALKAKYKEATGKDWQPEGGAPPQRQSKPKEEKKKQEKKPSPEPKKPQEDKDGGPKKQTRLGLEARKEENLADWYSQVITKAEMIEYYDVSGCYILRPWAYSIWDQIREFFDKRIKELGVENCYFPMFVSNQALEREKTHIADFAPEVAWVTKSGSSDLAEPIAIRPTSETVMYPSYAKWIKSHRDLPLKMNQWCNVVRWEFKHPQPFLRTREFLWQEGHTAFAKPDEAIEEVHQILSHYADVYEKLLAIPVIRGRKTEKEKFAGGDFTTTVEAFVPASGRGIQGATSHHLGQNFSKMFDIIYEHPETHEKEFVYQNSWGLTTRTIGVMVMVHGDNQGLVIPPQVAHHQVVIIPCGLTVNLAEAEKNKVLDRCNELAAGLRKSSVRVHVDARDNYSPGWKFNHWELKGVPLRVEVGPKDVASGQFVAVRRDQMSKCTMKTVEDIVSKLDEIQNDMFNKAKKERDDHVKVVESFADFLKHLEQKCIIMAPFCGKEDCEDEIKKNSTREESEPGAPAMGAKSLCIPFDQPKQITASTKCVNTSCTNKPQFYTLFGRSY